MKEKLSNKFNCIIIMAIIICAVALLTVCFTVDKNSDVADALYSSELEEYTFTLISDDAGNQSYQVAMRAARKPSVEMAIIPNVYNGLPVTDAQNKIK